MGTCPIALKDSHEEHIERLEGVDAEALAAEEKALLRKIDLYLLPTIWLMYLLSYVDRTKFVALYS
jgi:hypothetical protein